MALIHFHSSALNLATRFTVETTTLRSATYELTISASFWHQYSRFMFTIVIIRYLVIMLFYQLWDLPLLCNTVQSMCSCMREGLTLALCLKRCRQPHDKDYQLAKSLQNFRYKLFTMKACIPLILGHGFKGQCQFWHLSVERCEYDKDYCFGQWLQLWNVQDEKRNRIFIFTKEQSP